MNPEKQRIAIAEACGWETISHTADGSRYWRDPDGIYRGGATFDPTPNYLTDLNAIQSAIKALRPEQQRHVAWMLVRVVEQFRTWSPEDFTRLSFWEMSLYDLAECMTASPVQWCEAYLRTIGKWEEDAP